MKKYFYSVLMALFVAFSASYAQNVGIDYFKIGEYDIAKSVFQKEISQNPAEANYYLGEIAYAQGDMNKAKSHYEAGLAANPDYVLNNVGLGKVLYKSNAKSAEEEFSKARKKDKKDVKVLVAIAEAYYKNGVTKKVDEELEDAVKADKSSPLIFTFKGDMLKDQNNVGGAAGEYEQAILADANFLVAYVKIAQLYSTINPETSVDRLNKVLEINPDFAIVNKYLADSYFRNKRYRDAAETYEKFFSKGNYSLKEISNLAVSYYFTGQYDKAKTIAEEGIEKEPDNFVMNRFYMYILTQAQDYTKGLAQAEKFFALPKGDNEYISADYMDYGKLLKENDRFDDALKQYDLAIALDPSQNQIYKEIAETLANSGKNFEGAEYYQKYIDLAGDKVEALDYYNMGRYYYMAASAILKDSTSVENPDTKIKEYLAKADAAFTIVAERIPTSHLGFMYKARTNALLDPSSEQGLAKPYYEKMVEILEAKNDPATTKRDLLEAYRYLSYYYYVQYDKNKSESDKTQSVDYSQKMLNLDPENAVAKQIIDALK